MSVVEISLMHVLDTVQQHDASLMDEAILANGETCI